MNHKKEMLQWILELEEYARNQGLSMRILDSIEDCKQHIYKEDLPWQELRQQIEGVMESIGLKVQQTDVAVQKQNSNSASVEKVQVQIRRMAEECHRENIDSVSAIEKRKNINIREGIRQMSEISHTEAHLEEMLEKNRYVNYFQRVSNSYEQNMSKTASEMIGDINGNYDHMADHMKSMFQSIGGYVDGIGNERFYHEYETQKDRIEKKLISETQTVDYGGSSIMEFANKTKENIQQTVMKIISKKRLLAFIPIILLLVIVLGVTIVKYQKENGSEVSVEQSDDTNNKSIKDVIPKNEAEVYGLIAFLYFVVTLIVAGISNIVAFVLIFIVLYAFYLRKLKKWCNRRICEDCGTYLRSELAAFERENKLTQKADEAISQIVSDCEQQYLVILNRIFAGTKYEEKEAEEVSGFDDLQRKWNQLRYN